MAAVTRDNKAFFTTANGRNGHMLARVGRTRFKFAKRKRYLMVGTDAVTSQTDKWVAYDTADLLGDQYTAGNIAKPLRFVSISKVL